MVCGHSPDHHTSKSRHQQAAQTGLSAGKWIATAILLGLFAVTAHAVQQESHSTDLQQYLPLGNEIAQLKAKWEEGVTLPPPRTQSRILPLLPASTSVYLALPNYGDTLYQADQIFHQQLPDSPVLSQYWQQMGMATFVIEGVIDKVHQFSQYIGNEIAISGTLTEKSPSFLLVAEIKKPGLKAFLTDQAGQYGGKGSGVNIFTPQELLTTKIPADAKGVFVLVRPDFLVVSSDLATLRSFNAQLIRRVTTFAGTTFGQRLNQSYQQGVGILLGANLQAIQGVRPKGPEQNEAALRQSGFADAKFLIANYRHTPGQSASDLELSFNGPRQGVASWLAQPGPIGALDFISSSAAAVSAGLTKSPAQIFDDVLSITQSSNPNAADGLNHAESELNINFKQDIFNKLLGDYSLALDGPPSANLPWKFILKVSDAAGLQQTITKILNAANAKVGEGKSATLESHVESGQTYYKVKFAKAEKQDEVDYTFADGYLVVAGSQELVTKALEIHRNGTSVAKSGDFRAALPQGHPGECSAVFYQNIGRLYQTIAPLVPGNESIQDPISRMTTNGKSSSICFYGEPAAIRASSNSPAMELAVLTLPTAAIAIPNLMRSKIAANEATAGSVIRTLNTAEVSYTIDHPTTGYAGNFKALGDNSPLQCTPEDPCIKNGFSYSIAGQCESDNCSDYVVAAVPVSTREGTKSFCSTADAVVRSHPGSQQPASVAECQSWNPL